MARKLRLVDAVLASTQQSLDRLEKLCSDAQEIQSAKDTNAAVVVRLLREVITQVDEFSCSVQQQLAQRKSGS